MSKANFTHIPEYDQQINLDTLNIFSPSDRWRSLDNNDNNNTTRSIQAQQQSSTSKSIAANDSNRNTNNNLYCTPCKKKFSNEATFQGHLKSAKHIANEKKTKTKKTGFLYFIKHI
ncbi:hypothetical protein BDC45DRAFT_223567 [Circinella umbellata]|nr:hypothetical protein BDC45DRAFT_223567 [Circinella umbellata]